MHETRPVTGACVWHGSEMADSARWQRHLSPAQLAEIDRSLAMARARGVGWEAMKAEDFPLPSFMPLAAEIRAELEDGSGLMLLRGIEPERYSPDELNCSMPGCAGTSGRWCTP